MAEYGYKTMIKKIFLLTFFISLYIFLAPHSKILAQSQEIPPWILSPINLYAGGATNYNTVVSLGGISVPPGYCPEPFTVTIPLVNPAGITLTQSDFASMDAYLVSIGKPGILAQEQSIQNACNIGPNLYKCDPRFITAIWGQESTFGTAGGENFNCPVGVNGFYQGLSCAVNSVMSYYTTFTREMSSLNTAVSGSCKTTDLFTYMMEQYTPIASSSYGNNQQRTALNQFLTIFLGSQYIQTG